MSFISSGLNIFYYLLVFMIVFDSIPGMLYEMKRLLSKMNYCIIILDYIKNNHSKEVCFFINDKLI